MGNAMKRICTICARGGSKGVKNKNVRLLAGKPLIVHSIEQVRQSGLFDVLAVSSDSDEILRVAQEAGVDHVVKRPDELATDNAAKLPVIIHCVQEAERLYGNVFDIVVDVDATSPLRVPSDICGAVALLEESGVSNVITGAPARRSPYFNLVEEDANGVVQLAKKPDKPIVRRQDAPKCYDMNASIYVWKREALRDGAGIFNNDTRIFVMPEERSIDIDSELDFAIVELLLNKRQHEHE